MLHSIHSLTFGSLLFSRLSIAWVYHASCESIKDDLTAAMTSAFSMADAADKAISNKPIDPDVQALASLLLGKDVSKYNEVSCKSAEDPSFFNSQGNLQ